MALFRPTLGELSGSIGNTTFSHNKGGAYSRRRAIPTNPNTVSQQTIRIQLATLSAAWAGLTTNQQQEWRDWAAAHPTTNPLGDPRQRSGQQAYVGLNTRLLQMAAAALPDPPITNAPAGYPAPGIAWAAPGTITVTFSPTPLAAGFCFQLWSSIPGSLGRAPNFRQARLIAVSAPAQTSPWTATSRIPGVTGQQATLWLVVVDANGQASPPSVVQSVLT